MVSAIIVAGGKGKRMGQGINKQYIKLNQKEILAITIEAFNKCDFVDEIIIVVGEDEINYCSENIISKYKLCKVKKVIAGGIERQDSVYNGLVNCDKNTDIVLIHDGARPFITDKIIVNCIQSARHNNACTAAVPVKDTIKIVDRDESVQNTLKRDELYAIQTPQAFKYELILEAHKRIKEKGVIVTDDTMLIEAMNRKVSIVEGSYYNIKITTPEDLVFGRAIQEELEALNKE